MKQNNPKTKEKSTSHRRKTKNNKKYPILIHNPTTHILPKKQ